MIALLPLLLQAAALPAIGPIGRQELPARGCAAYLWSAADRQLIGMATADPAMLRLSVDGRRLDLPRAASDGSGALGFAASQRYDAGGVAATLAMTVVVRADLQRGGQVPSGLLTIERAGRDTVVLPVAGLIGCA